MTDEPAADIHTTARLIVAWVDEGRELVHVERTALGLARDTGARLILYDRDSASAFSDPMPNQWASEGEERLFGDPLSDEALVKLGVEAMARKVAQGRKDGIDTWGWLATGHGTDELINYARRHGADLVLLPAELAEPGLADRMKGETAARATEAAEPAAGDGPAVLLISVDGEVTLAAGQP